MKCYIFCCSGHNHGAIMTLQVLLMDTCMPILSENVHMHNDEFLYFFKLTSFPSSELMFFAYVVNSSLSIVMEVQMAWLTQTIFLCMRTSNFEDFVEYGGNKASCIFNPGTKTSFEVSSWLWSIYPFALICEPRATV